LAEYADFRPPKLGIGFIFSAGLRPFLQHNASVLDVLEIEPQTLWLADDPFQGPFHEFTAGIDLIAELPGHKLVHSVGVPLGGTRPPCPAQSELLRATAARLDSPWISEHLSVAGTPHQAAGFLLPPLQTEKGVATAVRNIRQFAEMTDRPVAIETGVAYLARKPFEMSDGSFVARVVEEADCGILLDLHNLYCNELNGRNSIDSFLSEIPLERVWEVHLAGGVEMDGYWLDSHNGPMPKELFARAVEIIKKLPNLGALNFEIFDTFLNNIDFDIFDAITEELRFIWNLAGSESTVALEIQSPVSKSNIRDKPTSLIPSPEEWEHALTKSVWKCEHGKTIWSQDIEPLSLYTRLAQSFRGSMLAQALPRTMRYLLIREQGKISELMQRYFLSINPKLYTPLEANAFVKWLDKDETLDPLLRALTEYDIAFLNIIREGLPQIVKFPGNPASVFEALAEARMPEQPPPPTWEIEILPDSFTIDDFKSNTILS